MTKIKTDLNKKNRKSLSGKWIRLQLLYTCLYEILEYFQHLKNTLTHNTFIACIINILLSQ